MRQIVLFILIGAVGFVVDAGIVQLLVSLFDADPYLARVGSFLAAATTTWVLNRSITFAGQRRYGSKRKELVRYLVAMSGGFALNYGTYAVLVYSFPLVRMVPALGVAAGSLAGAGINFLASKYWIFRVPGTGRA